MENDKEYNELAGKCFTYNSVIGDVENEVISLGNIAIFVTKNKRGKYICTRTECSTSAVLYENSKQLRLQVLIDRPQKKN